LFVSARPYHSKLLLGLAATVLASVAETAGPMLLKAGIDGIQASAGFRALTLTAGAILLVALIGSLFRFWMRDLIIVVSRWIESDLREGFFRHLLRLPPAFFDRNQTGDLMARATDDIERIRMAAGPALLYAVNTQLTILFSLAMMFYLNVKLAALVLLLAPLVGGAMLAIARALHTANLRQQETYGRMTSRIQENIAGLRVIKSYTREAFESVRFEGVAREYFSRSLVVARWQALMFPMIGTLIGLGIAGIVWIGGRQTAAGAFSLGGFVAFMSYLSVMTWPMIALGWVIHLYQRGSASHQRLETVMAEAPQFEPTVSEVREKPSDPSGGICFQGIGFRYRDDLPPVLDGFDLTIEPGTLLVLVGATGSGKSSIARLLARQYRPESGKIFLTGRPIDTLPIDDYRRNLAVVEQVPFLFSTTIRDNVRYGNRNATDKEVVNALDIAGLSGEVQAFPNSINTVIGERGITLSGGQQQRLALARALVRKAPILLLDDALSAVDTETEKNILDRLALEEAHRTIIFITHRLAVAERASKVAVLAEGKIVEAGSHSELMALDGHFAALYRLQRLRSELETGQLNAA